MEARTIPEFSSSLYSFFPGAEHMIRSKACRIGHQGSRPPARLSPDGLSPFFLTRQSLPFQTTAIPINKHEQTDTNCHWFVSVMSPKHAGSSYLVLIDVLTAK